MRVRTYCLVIDSSLVLESRMLVTFIFHFPWRDPRSLQLCAIVPRGSGYSDREKEKLEPDLVASH
jgi:hypothetical protein